MRMTILQGSCLKLTALSSALCLASCGDYTLVNDPNGSNAASQACSVVTTAQEETSGGAPTLLALDARGAASTASISAQDPLQISASGLPATTTLALVVQTTGGVEISPPGGFQAPTDQNGRLAPLSLFNNLLTPLAAGNYTLSVRDGASTNLAQATVLVADNQPRLVCADPASAPPAPRAAFLTSDNILVRLDKGGSGLADGDYPVFVRPDSATLIADTETLGTSSGVLSVSGGGGQINIGSFNPGAYDVVVDINNNGVFNTGVDLISQASKTQPCFAVQNPASAADISTQIAADRSGLYRDVFDINLNELLRRDVYAVTTPPTASLATDFSKARLYVVAHQPSWLAGTPLADLSGGFEIQQLQAGNAFQSAWPLWPKSVLVAGCYDAIIDVNGNGLYDPGTDFLDNTDNAGGLTCGFRVADPSCASRVVASLPRDNSVVEATAVQVQGTLEAGANSVGTVGIFGATAANSVGITNSNNSFNALVPLFQGRNVLQTAFAYQDGLTCAANTAVVAATNACNELIRVQMTWDGSTDSDLHFVRPPGTGYDNGGGGSDDCNFANCNVGISGRGTNSIDWGRPGEDDDPKLDVDCVACGNGIENIVMNQINQDGIYRIFVDQYSGSEDPVLVSVFIRGVLVGQVNCGAMSAGTATDSCKVGTISWSGGNNGRGTFNAENVKAVDFPPP